MPDGFIELESLLRAPAPPFPSPSPSSSSPAPRRTSESGVQPEVDARPIAACACGEERVQLVARELMLARLAALEAYERAVPRLLEALAGDVLGRELTLARADLLALARRLVEEFAAEEPVALVVAAEDAARFRDGLPVRIDPRLRAGDLVLEVRDGEIDSRFGVRLRAALLAAAPETGP